MSSAHLLLSPGASAPSQKSLSTAAWDALLANIYMPSSKRTRFKPILGLKFAAKVPSGNAPPYTRQLVRHNQATIITSTGSSWNSSTDELTVSTIATGFGYTSEVQLAGAEFYARGNRFELGIFAASVTPVVSFTKFYNLFLQQDDTNATYPYDSSNLNEKTGFKFNVDNIDLLHEDNLLHSYPMSYSATDSAAAGTVQFFVNNAAAVTSITNVPYSASVQVQPVASGANVYNINITDTYTGAVTAQAVNFVTDLVGYTDERTQVVGDTLNENVTLHVTGGAGSGKSIQQTGGTLPDGIIFANNKLVGTITKDGYFYSKFTVTDAAGQSADVIYSFTVAPMPNVTIENQSVQKGAYFAYKPNLPAGFTNISVTGGLPAGLNFDGTSALLDGIPTDDPGHYTVTADVTVNGHSESVSFGILVLDTIQVQYAVGNGSYTSLSPNDELEGQQGQIIRLSITGGSGNYSVSANNGAVPRGDNSVEFRAAGETTVTVIDNVTGVQSSYTFLVTSQGSVIAFATQPAAAQKITKNRPLLTQTGSNLTIAFAAMNLRNYASGQATKLSPIQNANFSVTDAGKALAHFVSLTNNAYLQLPSSKNFVVEHVVNATMVAANGDCGFGLGAFGELNYKLSLAITTVSGSKYVELRKYGTLISGTRTPIAAGQVVGFSRVAGQVGLYIDNQLIAFITGENLEEADLIMYSNSVNVLFGGQIQNLTYFITTPGSAQAVGSVNAVTGVYTPATDNVSKIRVRGETSNANIGYETDVLILKQTVIDSFNNSTLEGKSPNLFLADIERGDTDKLRFNQDGTPDANQIKNAVFLGTLQSTFKMDTQSTASEFKNDKSVYKTGFKILKINLTGAVLEVLNPVVAKAMIPFLEVHDEEIGTLHMSQKANGCIKPQRLIVVWESTSCSEVKVFDAFEFGNTASYTPVNIEIGSETATNLPMMIEAFPDKVTDVLWDFYRYDSQFVLI